MLQYVASLYISGCMTGSGDVVHNNATWKENDCTTCTCVHGRAECKSMLCEARCSSPRKVPGQCCPVCDGRCSNLKQVLPHIKPLLPITLLLMGMASCSCTIYKAPTHPKTGLNGLIPLILWLLPSFLLDTLQATRLVWNLHLMLDLFIVEIFSLICWYKTFFFLTTSQTS